MLSDVESFVCHGAILSCWSASVTVCWGSGGAGGAARVRAFVIVRARSAGPLARGFLRASMRVLSSTSISAALATTRLSFSACRVGTAALPNSQCLRARADYSTASDITATTALLLASSNRPRLAANSWPLSCRHLAGPCKTIVNQVVNGGVARDENGLVRAFENCLSLRCSTVWRTRDEEQDGFGQGGPVR